MSRINYPITIDELYEICKDKIAKGNGKKFVLLSNDEEGNGAHECYFGMSDAREWDGCLMPYDLDLKKCVVLG